MTDQKKEIKSIKTFAEVLLKFRKRKLSPKEIEEINFLIEGPKEISKEKVNKQSARPSDTEA